MIQQTKQRNNFQILSFNHDNQKALMIYLIALLLDKQDTATILRTQTIIVQLKNATTNTTPTKDPKAKVELDKAQLLNNLNKVKVDDTNAQKNVVNSIVENTPLGKALAD